jgi:hypothetical protein
MNVNLNSSLALPPATAISFIKDRSGTTSEDQHGSHVALGHLEEAAVVAPGLLAVPQLIPCLPPLMVTVAGGSEWMQLRPKPRGSLGGMVPEKRDLQDAAEHLGLGEVLVAVKAVGVNFRDVLNVS